MIDLIIEKLNQSGVLTFDSDSPNTSKGWISFQCPFCDDNSNHCAINESSLCYYCLRCGSKGHFSYLLRKLNIPFEPHHFTPNKSQNIQDKDDIQDKEDTQDKTIELMRLFYFGCCSDRFDEKKQKYIEKRLGSVDYFVKKYQLRYCSTPVRLSYGGGFNWSNRIIVPFFDDDEKINYIVGLTDRKEDDRSIVKSLNIRLPKILGFIDRAKGQTCCLVEGVLDAMAIGDGAICLFGKTLSDDNLKILIDRFDTFIIALDGDALLSALKLQSQLSIYRKKIYIYHFDVEHDPNSCPLSQKHEIIKFINKG